MFALRAIVASLSVFAIVYVLSSTLVALGWRAVPKVFNSRSAVALAHALYFVRVAPLLCAALAALAYELPSFLWFEPRSTHEALAPLVLFFSSLVLLGTAIALWRMTTMCRRTAAFCRKLLSETNDDGMRVFESRSGGPSVAVAGAFQQRLLLSATVVNVLEKEELHLALAHESAHIRSRDNLRKLILLACTFPGMSSLERAWADAAEFAADDLAVNSRREALALASAIVKVASLQVPNADPSALVTNFVAATPSVAHRVQRLAAWEKHEPAKSSRTVAIVSFASSAAVLMFSYPTVLSMLHTATEVLFR